MTGKRELVDTGTDKRYVRRDEQGRFDEVEDKGCADAQDRKQNDLFELAEHGLDLIDNVENMTMHVSTQDP